MSGTDEGTDMPMFTEIDPWRDEDYWPKNIGEDPTDLDSLGKVPRQVHMTAPQRKEGQGVAQVQRGDFPAPPSPCTCRKNARCGYCMDRDGLIASRV